MLKIVGIIALCLLAGAFAEEELDCRDVRARRLNETVTENTLIPECDSNDEYEAKQCFAEASRTLVCFASKDECVCYRRDGTNIGIPSKVIKACECVRARDAARQAGEDYRPTCQRDGFYTAKQCLAKECWCVDREGNALTDPETGDVQCE